MTGTPLLPSSSEAALVEPMVAAAHVYPDAPDSSSLDSALLTLPVPPGPPGVLVDPPGWLVLDRPARPPPG